MLQYEIYSHCIYRHYSGELYYVIGLAENTINYETMVVYHELFGDNLMYTSSLKWFKSKVPSIYDNPTNQNFRFELVQEV